LFEHENAGGLRAEKNLMRSVIIANVLAGLCCLAMVGYGLIMLMISQLDPMDPYDAGIALGCALFGTFLVVPAISIVRSIKLASINRRASISFALAPFAFVEWSGYTRRPRLRHQRRSGLPVIPIHKRPISGS
jgi:hypothetical protein